MRQRGEQGSVLSLICDAGERYPRSYHDADWVARTFGNRPVTNPVLAEVQAKIGSSA
jgi:cysteine synthase A